MADPIDARAELTHLAEELLLPPLPHPDKPLEEWTEEEWEAGLRVFKPGDWERAVRESGTVDPPRQCRPLDDAV